MEIRKENAPQIAAQQESAYNSAVGLVHSIEETTESGKKSIENGTKSLKKSIANITGLNLDEEVSKK